MTDDIRKMLCGICRVEVEARVDSDGNGLVRCPKCGESDTIDNATADAAKDFTIKMLDAAFSGIKLGGAIAVKKTPQPAPRFVFAD